VSRRTSPAPAERPYLSGQFSAIYVPSFFASTPTFFAILFTVVRLTFPGEMAAVPFPVYLAAIIDGMVPPIPLAFLFESVVVPGK